MSRKDALNSLFLKKPDQAAANPSAERPAERVKSGAIGAMGSALQEMAENSKAAARLQEKLASGDAVVTIAAKDIEGSAIADRLPTDNDPGFERLVASIADQGQQVPILVRPHPSKTGHYQIAYGRRRLRAAVRLDRPVRAIVRNLTDNELVVAQGRENLNREDLSFIERALFARRLEDAGFERAVIIAALSTDKANLSRYISVARSVPEDLAHAIGPAGKAGRARWVQMAEQLEQPHAERILARVTGTDEFRAALSDERFVMALTALAAPAKAPSPRRQVWALPNGRKAGRVEERDGKTALVFDEKVVPAFGSFIAERLDDLYRAYVETTREEGDADRT